MAYQTIQVEEVQDKIGIITLNRPEKSNAISIQMRREITNCMELLENRDDIGVVIITGTGTVFSAGFDLKEFSQPDLLKEIYESSAIYHRVIWHFPKPIIAAINGLVLGGGFNLAILCDMRICNYSASFGHHWAIASWQPCPLFDR
jgi:enoyl-CoA hydratase